MKAQTLYTVIIGKKACIVKYAASPAYEVKLFSGSFESSGEASQEFKKTMQGKLEYLHEEAFDRKVSTLASRYKQDLARLQAWMDGKGVSV